MELLKHMEELNMSGNRRDNNEPGDNRRDNRSSNSSGGVVPGNPITSAPLEYTTINKDMNGQLIMK